MPTFTQFDAKTMKLVQKLLVDVRTKMFKSEYRTVTFRKVSNLSHTDLEEIEMYAEAILQGDDPFNGSRMVSPEIRMVFVNSKIIGH